MAILVQDNFNRANSTTTVGTPQIGPAAAILAGNLGISSNQLYGSSIPSGGAIVYWACGTANVDITVKRSAGGTNSGGIVLGATTLNDFFYAYFNSDQLAGDKSYFARFTTSTSANQMLFGKNGSFITNATVLRAIHYNGIVEMWADSVLVLRGMLPEALTTQYHGIRVTQAAHRFDDLTISDAPDITMPVKDGQVREPVYGTQTLNPKDSFLYRGRDTKTQDITGVS